MEQLDLFGTIETSFELSDEDILKHAKRLQKEVSNKSGAVARIMRARYDDMLAKKIAEENLSLRKKVKHLEALLEAREGIA